MELEDKDIAEESRLETVPVVQANLARHNDDYTESTAARKYRPQQSPSPAALAWPIQTLNLLCNRSMPTDHKRTAAARAAAVSRTPHVHIQHEREVSTT